MGCFFIPFVAAGIFVAGYAGWTWYRFFDLATAEYVQTSCFIESKRLDTWVQCNDDNNHGRIGGRIKRRLREAAARRLCTSYEVGVFFVNPTPDLRTSPTGSLEAFEYADRMGSSYTSAAGNPFYYSIVENSTVPCWQRDSAPETVKLSEERATGSGSLVLPIFLTFFSCCWNLILCGMMGGICSSLVKVRGVNIEDEGSEEDANLVGETNEE